MTQDPDGWLEKAIAQELSVKELGQAISDSKDCISEAEEARRAAERLIQAARKFNERFAQTAGQRVVITWEPLASFKDTGETSLVARSA